MIGRYAKLPKQRTAADRRRDVILFLSMARPEKVAEATPQMLASRYGVTLDVAHECLRNARPLL